MNAKNQTNTTAYFVGILGSFLIVAALVWAMKHYMQPAPLSAARAAERKKNLAELGSANDLALNQSGWVDQNKGIVRLKIDQAMKLTVQEYARSPAAARSNLLARSQKAAAVAPPPPNQYE
jgi:hypothetical protein